MEPLVVRNGGGGGSHACDGLTLGLPVGSSPAATKRKKRLFGEDEEDDNKSDWDEACGPSEGVEGERWGVGSDCWSADED